MEQSPAQGIKAFKETPNPPRLLEQDEVARLLEELPEHFHALVACAVYAGLRRSKLFHLRWDDIDWRTAELTVVSSKEHHTKNYKSRRIPINGRLAEALGRHPRRLHTPYVFSNRDGQPYTDIREPLNEAAERAGLNGPVGLHQLRHNADCRIMPTRPAS